MGGPRATVLQVLPRLESGGVERGTVEIARGLVEAGWGAVVAAERGRLAQPVEQAGARYVELPLATKNPLHIVQNARRLERVIREHGVDLVHARSRAPAWSAEMAAKRAGVPFVTTFHAVYSGATNPLKHRYNAVMARGSRVIAISDFVAEHARSAYGVEPQRLRTIYRAVDLEAFDRTRLAPERLARLAQAWHLPHERRIIMLPGRVMRLKGHLELLRAVKRLNRDDLVVVFVGPSDPGDAYRRQVELFARTAGLADQVIFAGQCDDMPAALAWADVVAVPSIERAEGFGRVSIEAQAMGVPVVVHAIGGLPETLMPAATGWLVQPGDIDELADALNLALDLPGNVRARAAERARAFVTEHFSLERMVRQTLDVYREVLPVSA
ncbi:MAG: glycosyltransferase [Geminicoccaceae bacterium]|nr:MAG: glycosyltransferase [Geminicoccaceae bacterium]